MSDKKSSHSYHEKRSESLAIVSFPVDIGGVKTFENMHAARCWEKNYVLDNSPFYAYGDSAGDRLAVDEIDGRLVFSRVLERGGHSTYRMKLAVGKNHEFFLRHWPLLAALGCYYEGSAAEKRLLYAIDLPQSVDVYAALQAGEDNGLWEFEAAHYCKPEEHPT